MAMGFYKVLKKIMILIMLLLRACPCYNGILLSGTMAYATRLKELSKEPRIVKPRPAQSFHQGYCAFKTIGCESGEEQGRRNKCDNGNASLSYPLFFFPESGGHHNYCTCRVVVS